PRPTTAPALSHSRTTLCGTLGRIRLHPRKAREHRSSSSPIPFEPTPRWVPGSRLPVLPTRSAPPRPPLAIDDDSTFVPPEKTHLPVCAFRCRWRPALPRGDRSPATLFR